MARAKRRYKYIHFDLNALYPNEWICRNNKTNDELGRVEWYGPWKRYCFFPTAPAVFDAKCLANIIDFIEEVTAEKANG